MRVGFIGFGEAARALADQLHRPGVGPLSAFCRGARNRPPYTPEFVEEAGRHGVTLVKSLDELAATSDLIVSAVLPTAAVEVSREVAPHLAARHLYVDVNASTPSAKREAGRLVEASGARYVDGALMGAVSLYGGAVPIYASGSGAEAFREATAPAGFQVTVVGSEAGMASVLKALRSVVTKGMASVIVEAMVAARRAGIVEEAFEAITGPMDKVAYSDFARMCITTDAIHADRRAAEMEGVIEVVRELGLEPIMTEATRRRLLWSAAFGLREVFGTKPPEDYRRVLELYDRLDRERRPPSPPSPSAGGKGSG